MVDEDTQRERWQQLEVKLDAHLQEILHNMSSQDLREHLQDFRKTNEKQLAMLKEDILGNDSQAPWVSVVDVLQQKHSLLVDNLREQRERGEKLHQQGRLWLSDQLETQHQKLKKLN